MYKNVLAVLVGAVLGAIMVLVYPWEYEVRATPHIAPPVEPAVVPMDNIPISSPSDYTVSEDTVYISYEDAQILLRITEAEAGNCSIEERALVMATVLNRVESKDFPNTIEGVVFQKRQFSPVRNGSYYKAEISEETHLALAQIEEGKYTDFEALYFENCKGSSWHSRNLTKVDTEIDTKHKFYK